MIKATETFQRALLFIDEGETRAAEIALRQALELAELESDELTLGGALFCLADLLIHLQRRDEAEPLLVRLTRIQREDAVLASEIESARDLLHITTEPVIAS